MNDQEKFIADFAENLRERRSQKAQASMQVKNYHGAEATRLTADWPTQIYSPTAILQYSLRSMRARCRDLELNNDYAKKFLWMVGINIGGPEGIKLQNKAKMPNGILDKLGNDKIEEAWQEWNKKGNFDVTGQLDGALTDGLVPRTVARDGEVLIRIVEGFDNDWGFALQFIEADYLDETLNVARLQNGNSLRMGVEFDKWFRPVAYHLRASHPGDSVWAYNSIKYERVDAANIIHLFMTERFNQPRGVPWMHSAMTRLNNLGAYEEAEIIGSRIGASHMGWYVPGEDSDINGLEKGADDKDAAGNLISEVEPGVMGQLPKGWTVQQFDPKHPAGNFAPFMKSALRGISAGMLVSYNSLANDLESVNYSSLRAGAIEERDSWKVMQAWCLTNYKRPIFERWLKMALLNGKVWLPPSKFAQFNKPKFQPRVWAWIDPEKDISANILALDNLLTTRTDVAAEQGEDFEEILIRRKEEDELMQKYGVQPVPKYTGTNQADGQGDGSGGKGPGKQKKAPAEDYGTDMKKSIEDLARTVNTVAALVKDLASKQP